MSSADQVVTALRRSVYSFIRFCRSPFCIGAPERRFPYRPPSSVAPAMATSSVSEKVHFFVWMILAMSFITPLSVYRSSNMIIGSDYSPARSCSRRRPNMFGSLGLPELLMIFAVILIVFGPRRIPEIGRTLGKALAEFRKATDDLKGTIEREVRIEELKKITPAVDR